MVKRKFEDDGEVVMPQTFKRPSYHTRPSGLPLNVEIGMDTDMASTSDNLHSSNQDVGLWSNAATIYPPTSDALYPFPTMDEQAMDCDQIAALPDFSSANKGSKAAFEPVFGRPMENRFPSDASSIGVGSSLMQPKEQAYSHHSTNCTQIPKLRLSAYPNSNGERTMWTHCEECGAIEMIKGCDGQPIAVGSA